MEYAHRVSKAAYAGLVIIFVGLIAFAVSAAYATKAAAHATSVAIGQIREFRAASAEIGAEHTHVLEYRIMPGPARRARYALLARLQDEHLHRQRATPGFSEVAGADRRYDRAVAQLFRAIDAGNSQAALARQDSKVEAAFSALSKIVEARVLSARSRSDAALRALDYTENTMLRSTIVISVIGSALLAMILLTLRRYERLVRDAMGAELTRFKHASLTDYLTGLGNHRAYQEDLVRDIATCRRTGSVVTVALVDVDDFKVLNDREGHVTGDQLLSSLAHVLRAAELSSIPYRLGGDEFALVFAGMSSAVAKVRMEQVRAAAAARLHGTTISIGISTSMPHQPDLVVVREQADAALYEAKRRGRNRVVLFDDIREEYARFLPASVAEVRRLIAAPTIGVAFQPIWGIDGRSILGYEALARPDGDSPMNPQDAFDIAERIGKAHELDRVCRTSILAKARELPANALLFLNVCPQSLDHDELAGTALVDALQGAGLTPDRVVLEITELSVARIDVVIREATRLRALGFRLALDDAGSGNAGLEILSKLVVDYVKIDREVVARAQAGVAGHGVLAGIVAIAREMHAQIVAEGIEDAAMLDLVRRATRHSPIDCAVQGFYLGRPQAGFVDELDVARTIARLAGPLEMPHVTAEQVAM